MKTVIVAGFAALKRWNTFSGTSADEKDARDRRGKMRESERPEGGREGKVCERLTFPFLLWDLVLVKRFSDFLVWRLRPP